MNCPACNEGDFYEGVLTRACKARQCKLFDQKHADAVADKPDKPRETRDYWGEFHATAYDYRDWRHD